MRVSIVIDDVGDWSGSERVLDALTDLYPESDVFCLTYRPAKGALRLPARLTGLRKHVSRLDRARLVPRLQRKIWAPHCVKAFDLEKSDLVISISRGWAVGARRPPKARHISVILKLWDGGGVFKRRNAKFEQEAVSRGNVDVLVVESPRTAEVLRDRLGRDADIILPGWIESPAAEIQPVSRGRHFVTVGPVRAEKDMNVLIEAFRRLREPLLIIGDGPERRRLQGVSAPSVEWLGPISGAAMRDVLKKSRAFVTASREGFQNAAAEAKSLGLETLGWPGISVGELVDLISRWMATGHNSSRSRADAGISREAWTETFRELVNRVMGSEVTSGRSSSGTLVRGPSDLSV